MKVGDYNIGNIYQGGYSSLKPDYGDIFTGYHSAAGNLGAPTKPDTANQIQQINQLLNQGIIPLEAGVLQPETFEQIPKQHFKEINRMAKLTGAKVSLHAPLIEPSGIDPEQRRPWDESYRELAERQLSDAVKKSMEMSDKESIPITIHGSNIPGTEFKMTKEGKKMDRLVAINKESGKMIPLEEEEKYYPYAYDEKGKIIPPGQAKASNPMKELRDLNITEWDNSLSQVIFYKEGADKILSEMPQLQRSLYTGIQLGNVNPNDLEPSQKDVLMRLHNADEHIKHSEMVLRSLYNKAYKYGTKEDQENLKKLAEEYKKALGVTPNGNGKIEQKDLLKRFDLLNQSRALNVLIGGEGKVKGLREIIPEMYVPVEDFAVENSSKTFANVAFSAYEEAKKKNKPVPIISIENMFPGMSFSTGEKIEQLILESRNNFRDRLVKEKGMSKGDAQRQADKMIGMTLDVGHLNIHKKKGFKDEDLLKEVKKIAKHVKHIHLTDNFGYSDSHLPPGMGNVPFKEILEKLEKEGKVEEVRKIVEAGGWVQHFQSSPLQYTFEGMGSPIYADGVGPYWNQTTGLYQGYFGGMGMMLPQTNYETFGAGFSQLPVELGGQKPGAAGSRMSGKGME